MKLLPVNSIEVEMSNHGFLKNKIHQLPIGYVAVQGMSYAEGKTRKEAVSNLLAL